MDRFGVSSGADLLRHLRAQACIIRVSRNLSMMYERFMNGNSNDNVLRKCVGVMFRPKRGGAGGFLGSLLRQRGSPPPNHFTKSALISIQY